MPTERFEKTYELRDAHDVRREMRDKWIWEYYGSESSTDMPDASALSSEPVRFVTRQSMTVVDNEVLTATNVEVSVRSDRLVAKPHGMWYQEHLLPVLDSATASALANAPGLLRRSFVERRTSWAGGQMRYRGYPISGEGVCSVSFVFDTEAQANAFQPPSWSSILPDTLQERHVYSVEVAKDPAPMEYEVRYLVDPQATTDFKSRADRRWYGQVYLVVSKDASLRVREIGVEADDDELIDGQIALKGPRVNGARLEVQGVLPRAVARSFQSGTFPSVQKYRYYAFTGEEHAWALDEFLNENAPLHIAECEVNSPEELAAVPRQPFCTTDITGDRAYNNEWLAVRPFSTWDS